MFSFSGTLAYAQIDVDPKQVTLTEGEKTSLLCRSGNKINYCRFIVPGAPQVLVLSETWPSKTPGYSYFGQGLAAGQCGVTIDRVIPQNHGQAKCFLGIEGDEIEGQIELTVACKYIFFGYFFFRIIDNNMYKTTKMKRTGFMTDFSL